VGEAAALGCGGFVEWSMARLGSAHEHVAAGLRIARKVGNRHVEAFGLLGLGMVCRDLGRLREAAAHLELVISRGAALSWWDDSPALQTLGGVYWELGRLATALTSSAPG